MLSSSKSTRGFGHFLIYLSLFAASASAQAQIALSCDALRAEVLWLEFSIAEETVAQNQCSAHWAPARQGK